MHSFSVNQPSAMQTSAILFGAAVASLAVVQAVLALMVGA